MNTNSRLHVDGKINFTVDSRSLSHLPVVVVSIRLLHHVARLHIDGWMSHVAAMRDAILNIAASMLRAFLPDRNSASARMHDVDKRML